MILLTTPFNPGDLDTGTYERVRIISFNLDSVGKRLSLTCQYGNYVNEVWVAGIAPQQHFYIFNLPDGYDGEGELIPANPAYDDMIAQFPAEGETIYQGAARELYQWLLDNEHFAGTIVT